MKDVLSKRFGEEQAKEMVEAEEGQARKMVEAEREEKHPFQRIRELHGITMEELLGDVDGAISSGAIACFDLTGKGTYFVIDACLDSLSRLAGEEYTRENVGGIVELPFLRKKGEAEPEQTGP